ncbi:hypothetical protein QAD02_002604 [Eretmocerus hayati]|uniref:Uncharacterized protein n=1 Tax=Eretmocerus hayati TaxID=131215 RepID=A0ACC2NJH3_9HYME|nr:hypothetical protein QAD02_002604 [Eretmocerus hayati]
MNYQNASWEDARPKTEYARSQVIPRTPATLAEVPERLENYERMQGFYRTSVSLATGACAIIFILAAMVPFLEIAQVLEADGTFRPSRDSRVFGSHNDIAKRARSQCRGYVLAPPEDAADVDEPVLSDDEDLDVREQDREAEALVALIQQRMQEGPGDIAVANEDANVVPQRHRRAQAAAARIQNQQNLQPGQAQRRARSPEPIVRNQRPRLDVIENVDAGVDRVGQQAQVGPLAPVPRAEPLNGDVQMAPLDLAVPQNVVALNGGGEAAPIANVADMNLRLEVADDENAIAFAFEARRGDEAEAHDQLGFEQAGREEHERAIEVEEEHDRNHDLGNAPPQPMPHNHANGWIRVEGEEDDAVEVDFRPLRVPDIEQEAVRARDGFIFEEEAGAFDVIYRPCEVGVGSGDSGDDTLNGMVDEEVDREFPEDFFEMMQKLRNLERREYVIERSNTDGGNQVDFGRNHDPELGASCIDEVENSIGIVEADQDEPPSDPAGASEMRAPVYSESKDDVYDDDYKAFIRDEVEGVEMPPVIAPQSPIITDILFSRTMCEIDAVGTPQKEVNDSGIDVTECSRSNLDLSTLTDSSTEGVQIWTPPSVIRGKKRKRSSKSRNSLLTQVLNVMQSKRCRTGG